MTGAKRTYHSPRRREQAAETRRRILGAARRLFVEAGYGGATMDAVAAEAGVAVQTVYAAVGSKKEILLALLDEMAADADLPAMEAAVAAAAGDPRRQLRERLAFTTRFYDSGADLLELGHAVSGVEPDLRDMWTEGEGRRHRAASSLVAEWDAAGALAPGVTPGQAADLFWALSGPDVFRLLVRERGWTLDRFRERIADLLEGALFGPPPGGDEHESPA